MAVQAPVKKVGKEGPAEEAPVKTEEGTAGVDLGFMRGWPLSPGRYPMRATHIAPLPRESTAPTPALLWPLRLSSDDLIY